MSSRRFAWARRRGASRSARRRENRRRENRDLEGDPSMIFRTTLLASLLLASVGAAHAQQAAPSPAGDDPAALRAEIERLKSIVPGQATAMTQVAYNFINLWFAAHAENWPLAQFYASETRVRLRWALRITPVRKISTGDLELQPLLDALEKGPLAKVGEAITAKNVA